MKSGHPQNQADLNPHRQADPGGRGTGAPSKPAKPPQGQTNQQSQKPPRPCYASRSSNPNVGRNIGVTATVGGFAVGIFAAVNIVGFPEIEVGEGVGALLGGLSALGDPGLIFLNYAPYGAVAGGTVGFVSTSPQCPGN